MVGSELKTISIADIITQTTRTSEVTGQKVRDIRQVTAKLRILALNALIEAKHAGDKGAGFSVVADEVRAISSEVEGLAKNLGDEISKLNTLTHDMVEHSQGMRLTDLALNAIEIIDRNLYERTCDVRWWATDAAVVQQACTPSHDQQAFTNERLGVILGSYTVYLDLWLCDLQGNIIANGRPSLYPVTGQNVSNREWFKRALNLHSGEDYTVADVESEPLLQGNLTATYAAGVRAEGKSRGALAGVLGIHFDWQPQARTVVEGVRLTPEERTRTRVLLTDAKGLVLAASDGRGLLQERINLRHQNRLSGSYTDEKGQLIAFHKTPGYETYPGLGWYGVLIQKPA
ncbi:MAG: methyl-accepting chemotaxis protein [Asticcacaulis sp.]